MHTYKQTSAWASLSAPLLHMLTSLHTHTHTHTHTHKHSVTHKNTGITPSVLWMIFALSWATSQARKECAPPSKSSLNEIMSSDDSKQIFPWHTPAECAPLKSRAFKWARTLGFYAASGVWQGRRGGRGGGVVNGVKMKVELDSSQAIFQEWCVTWMWTTQKFFPHDVIVTPEVQNNVKTKRVAQIWACLQPCSVGKLRFQSSWMKLEITYDVANTSCLDAHWCHIVQKQEMERLFILLEHTVPSKWTWSCYYKVEKLHNVALTMHKLTITCT